MAFRILSAVVVALSLASAASGNDLTGRFGVGGTIGPSFPIGNEEFKDGKTVGLGGGGALSYGINRRWSTRVGYDNYDPPACNNGNGTSGTGGAVQATGSGGENGGSSSSLETVQLSGVYALDPASAWNPSARVGVGPAWAHGVSSLNKETHFGVSAGLGFDRFVTPNITVGGALDWLGVMGQGSGDAHAIRPGLTAGYWFGGSK